MQPPRNHVSTARSDHDFQALADALLPGVLEAGRLIMSYFRVDVGVEQKGDDSPVTRADREAEALLVEALGRVTPAVPVVGEELFSRNEAPHVDGTLWLVDPLDGTRGFINGRDEFTVNLGLIEAGRPTFGMIFAPALGQLYVTQAADIALSAAVEATNDARTLQALTTHQIQTRAPETGSLVVIDSRYKSKRLEKRLAQLGGRRIQANSSIKFCMLSAGQGDVYPRYSRICEWDTAAGVAILQAAGGCATDMTGAALVYGKAADDFRNEPFFAWAAPEPQADLMAALTAED